MQSPSSNRHASPSQAATPHRVKFRCPALHPPCHARLVWRHCPAAGEERAATVMSDHRHSDRSLSCPAQSAAKTTQHTIAHCTSRQGGRSHPLGRAGSHDQPWSAGFNTDSKCCQAIQTDKPARARCRTPCRQPWQVSQGKHASVHPKTRSSTQTCSHAAPHPLHAERAIQQQSRQTFGIGDANNAQIYMHVHPRRCLTSSMPCRQLW